MEESMKRSAFFATLAGFLGIALLAIAQTGGGGALRGTIGTTQISGYVKTENATPDGLGTPQWRWCKVPGYELPKLGEQPWHCGIAGYKPARANQCPVCGTMAEPFKAQQQGHAVVTFKPGGPSKVEQVTRCLRCNAAFWQDGEK
jgi:hypothetical protein